MIDLIHCHRSGLRAALKRMTHKGWRAILWGRLRPRCLRLLGFWPFWDAFWHWED